MNPLFESVVATSRISSLFAEHAVARACERAGVNPQTLSPATLRIALPELKKTILTFCHHEAGDILLQLSALAELGSLLQRSRTSQNVTAREAG